MQVPEEYRGREQALVKHTLLKSYLQRLFMIIGRGKESVINYVDCFAGPWQENDERLSDTSIGISLTQIDLCRQGLQKDFQRNVKFRALYIEKNPEAFRKLQHYLASTPHSGIETRCLQGDYVNLLSEIVDWCGPHFTFFFVDPMGWLKVVGAEVMGPLLQLPKSEFVINLMYDFVNRAASIPKHEQDMVSLFGKAPKLGDLPPESRKSVLLQMYRDELIKEYGGRSTYVPIEKPGKERVHYFLVYLTRNAIGLKTFKEIAQDMEILQRRVQTELKVQAQSDRSGTQDMFADSSPPEQPVVSADILRDTKSYLIQEFAGRDVLFDYEAWADLLEKSDYLPSELQAAMKSLVDDGLVENLDCDISRRRKHIVAPKYRAESERWRFKGRN